MKTRASPLPPPPSPEAQRPHSRPRRTSRGGGKKQRPSPLLSLLAVAAGGAAAAWVLSLRARGILVPGSGGSSGVSQQEVRFEGKPTLPLGDGDSNSSGGDGDGGGGGGGGGGGDNGEGAVLAEQQQQQQQQRRFFFDAPDGPSAPGVGHGHDHQQQQQFQQRERQPSCDAAASDDPEYSCLLARPPGSFRDEIKVYFSFTRSAAVAAVAEGDGRRQQQEQQEQQQEQEERKQYEEEQQLLLSVKIVVPAAASPWRGKVGPGRGSAEGWASLGFSPNGRMAGPSEAVVGFIGEPPEGSMQEPASGVLRYRMDGYSAASVTPLPARQQVLADQAVEIASNGSLVVRFKRPLLDPSALSRGQDACAAAAMVGGIRAEVLESDGAAVATAAAAAASGTAVCKGGPGEGSDGMGWLDPREEGVVLLWAYGRGAWPSYHDATGAFLLPQLALEA